MKIYIDEAGPFIPPKGKRRYSAVLAIVVPEATEADLLYEFLRLRDSWPDKGVEIKGSTLNEGQTAQVLRLLAAYDVIAECHAIDMTLHPDKVIDDFKNGQAAALTQNLTPMHAPAVAQRAHDEAEAIRKLANPLFVQAFVTIELILDMLEVAINYFAQRRPAELRRFAWMIDRKDRAVTEMERLWSGLFLPFGEPRSAQRPFSMVEGFDYSHFARYKIDESTADERMKQHLRWMRETLPFSEAVPDELHCIDLKRIWEECVFEDSRNSLGLQLADMAATTLCRALNGNLQRPGWEPLARLLIRKKTAPFIQLGKAARQHPDLEPHAARVWRILDAGSQAMVLESRS
jgi:hypothetical protein